MDLCAGPPTESQPTERVAAGQTLGSPLTYTLVLRTAAQACCSQEQPFGSVARLEVAAEEPCTNAIIDPGARRDAEPLLTLTF